MVFGSITAEEVVRGGRVAVVQGSPVPGRGDLALRVLYFRFPLSFREVEELMLQRGVIVSHETVRRWCAKFGQAYADELRRRCPQPGDKWHLDEVFIKINGVQKYLWRAVDQDGNVLDIHVQNRRDKAARPGSSSAAC
jgi:transposase-like protein